MVFLHPEYMECGDLSPLWLLGKRCRDTALQKGDRQTTPCLLPHLRDRRLAQRSPAPGPHPSRVPPGIFGENPGGSLSPLKGRLRRGIGSKRLQARILRAHGHTSFSFPGSPGDFRRKSPGVGFAPKGAPTEDFVGFVGAASAAMPSIQRSESGGSAPQSGEFGVRRPVAALAFRKAVPGHRTP